MRQVVNPYTRAVPEASPTRGPANREMPPRGFYHAAEVGSLAGVSGNTIGQWKRRGYIRASRDGIDYPNIYSYQDIGEALVVHELIQIQGIKRSDILAAISALRDTYGYSWPLTHGDVRIADSGLEGRPALVVGEGGSVYDVSRPAMWQAVLEWNNIRKLALHLRHGGWAARELGDLQHIEVNPNRLSGRPAIRGTRVFAESAAEMASTREGVRTLKQDYGLTGAQIRDAVRWLDRVRTYEAAA